MSQVGYSATIIVYNSLYLFALADMGIGSSDRLPEKMTSVRNCIGIQT